MIEPGDVPADSLARDLRLDPARAAGRVDAEFRDRLLRLADRVIDPRVRGALDAEDVAQSVFRSFFARPVAVDTRLDLWHLLATIARRKCVRAARRTLALKRGGGRVVPLPGGGDDSTADGVVDPVALPPHVAAVVADLCDELRARLDAVYCRVCDLRLEGHTVPEIAAELKVTTRTVERRLAKVRERLASLDPADPNA
jgi:RNA polymerase sigma-70 factor (ECF subfamily)